MECVSKVAETAINLLLDLAYRHVVYIINYSKNVGELDSLVNNLELARDRLIHGIEAAENNLGIIEGDVSKWIQDVDEIIEKIEKFKKDEGSSETGCSSGILPYLWNRHRLGRKAKKIAADVKLLLTHKSQSDGGVSYQQTLPISSMDTTLSNVAYEHFGSREDTMEDIMKKLEDSTVRMIGVHGQGGVGKSTLIKEIAKKALDKKLFKVVVKVDITHNPNLPKIQEEIASRLGLRLEGEGETVRADRLRKRLKKQKESTLIILDDLWDGLDLNKIGIPFDDDDGSDISHMTAKDMKDPIFKIATKGKSSGGDYKGCKVVLTSRDKKVLSDKIDVKLIFCVGKLNDEESLRLFQKVTQMSGQMSISKQEIVKKYCAGLPVAIVMVGRALRDTSESVWESTLENSKKKN